MAHGVLDYFIRLLMFSQGIVYKRTILDIRFPNLVVGEEGHLNNCRILWPSERTSFPIQTSEQRVVVLQRIHTKNQTA